MNKILMINKQKKMIHQNENFIIKKNLIVEFMILLLHKNKNKLNNFVKDYLIKIFLKLHNKLVLTNKLIKNEKIKYNNNNNNNNNQNKIHFLHLITHFYLIV